MNSNCRYMAEEQRSKISLSKRLLMSADMVKFGKVVADIGCDHAHTCIWLIKNGIAERAIAMDVRSGPLEKAKGNISLYGLSDRIELRLSDGLKALCVGEADSIIIAGMGGMLTEQILRNGIDKAVAAKELILQPQSDIGLVRRFLRVHDFRITEERMCVEAGKFYNSMRAVPDRNIEDSSSDLNTDTDLNADSIRSGERNLVGSVNAFSLQHQTEVYDEYGEYLLKNRNPVLKELLLVLQRKNERNLKRIEASTNEQGLAKRTELEREKKHITEALRYYAIV